jgi:hypothetical protein
MFEILIHIHDMLAEDLFHLFSIFLSSAWTRKRSPNNFLDSVDQARSAQNLTTSKIFFDNGFQAWVAYFILKPGSATTNGQAARRCLYGLMPPIDEHCKTRQPVLAFSKPLFHLTYLRILNQKMCMQCSDKYDRTSHCLLSSYCWIRPGSEKDCPVSTGEHSAFGLGMSKSRTAPDEGRSRVSPSTSHPLYYPNLLPSCCCSSFPLLTFSNTSSPLVTGRGDTGYPVRGIFLSYGARKSPLERLSAAFELVNFYQ